MVHLAKVKGMLDSNYGVAAQNVWVKGPGAYTGEVPAEILRDLGIDWCITGHSERRSLCGESNELVGQKTARALEQGMSVIPCIGETLEQRNAGQLFKVLEAQVQALVDHVKDWSRIVVAYEPVWAIGTGVVATPAQAQEVHAFLRK
jgi:triosephosphate isomerase